MMPLTASASPPVQAGQAGESPATISTHLNGGTFPFAATDEETHAYAMAGTYDLKVTVSDDDGGTSGMLVTVIII